MPEPERHASWLELFFDLVAVAGISQLAHLLRGAPSLGDVSLYALLYLAFWTAWACIVTYGNVTDEESQAPRVLAAMFGLAVMAAAVTEVRSDRAVGPCDHRYAKCSAKWPSADVNSMTHSQ